MIHKSIAPVCGMMWRQREDITLVEDSISAVERDVAIAMNEARVIKGNDL
jgi:hypothetical protein